MFPWDGIREDLKTGFERVRKGILSSPHLIIVEVDIIRLTMNLRKIDGRIDSLYVELGRWAYEKYKTHGLSGFKESETVSLFKEIELALSERNRVSADMEELRQWKMEKQGE